METKNPREQAGCLTPVKRLERLMSAGVEGGGVAQPPVGNERE